MHHSLKLYKSDCKCNASLSEVIDLKMFVSSANNKILEYLIMEVISLIKSKNKIGVKWSPCGTPYLTLIK